MLPCLGRGERRRVFGSAVMLFVWAAPAVAVDREGTISVLFWPMASHGLEIAQFAAGTASGFIKPIRSISLPGTSMGPNTLDVDSSGTVYALMAHPSFAQLFVAAASSTTATQILQSFPIRAFAVDDSGDVFAATVSGSPIHSDVALLEFSPGATSPERTIKGPNTALFSPPVPDAVGVPRQR